MRQSCYQLALQAIVRKFAELRPTRHLQKFHHESYARLGRPNDRLSLRDTSSVLVRSFASIPKNEESSLSQAPSAVGTTTSKVDAKSLHQSIHYLLTKVPIGRMNEANIQKARSFLFIASKWKNEQGATLSESLLHRLFAEQSVKPTVDTEMYNACMSAWNTSGADGNIIVQHVESIFATMEQRSRDTSNRNALMERPDRTSYNCLLNSYSKSSLEDYSFKVDAILNKMNSIEDNSKVNDEEYAIQIQPDTITYNSIMNYYASKSNQHYAAQQAEDILLKMSELTQQSNSYVQITSTSFNIAIKAWSNAGLGLHGAERAKSLLLMMIKWHDQGHSNVEPTAISFSTVIDAYSKVSRADATVAVENAMELLDLMEASSISDAEHIHSCYNNAANVYIKMDVSGAGDSVRKLMLRMKNVDAVPDEMMYIRCIQAYIMDGNDKCFEEAQRLLDEFADVFGCNPSSVSFNSLLHVLIQSKTTQTLGMAEDLFTKMESLGGDSRPDTASYSMIIGALARSLCPGSERKAVEYLRKMLRSFSADNNSRAKPNSFVFTCILGILSRSAEEWADNVIYKTLVSMENQQRKGNDLVMIDTITYNTVIGKLSKRRTKGNAKKVMKLLADMENNEATGNNYAAPDIITYTSVLKLQQNVDPTRAATIASSYLKNALTKSRFPSIDRVGLRALLVALSTRGTPDDASLVLRTWERIENDAATQNLLNSDLCNLVLLAFGRTKTPQSSDSVLAFLTERFKRIQNGDSSVVLPTVIGINSALSNLASNRRVNDALSIIEIMKVLSKRGVAQSKPDVGCYVTILKSLSRNRVSTKSNALYAQKVLGKANDDLDIVPISVINAAIDLCATTTGDQDVKMKAVQIAFDIFDQAKEAQSHNDATFELMIRVCMKLSSDYATRIKLVQRLFQLCARDGVVGKFSDFEGGTYDQLLGWLKHHQDHDETCK
eukprot:scaffold81936_cov56-Cyclotella_meneghiniana.AAC.5